MVKYGLYEDTNNKPDKRRYLEETPVENKDQTPPKVEDKTVVPETKKDEPVKSNEKVEDKKEEENGPTLFEKEKKDAETQKKEHKAKAHAHREIRYNDGLYYSFETYRKQLDYDYNKQIKEVEEFNIKQKEKGSNPIMQENVPFPT